MSDILRGQIIFRRAEGRHTSGRMTSLQTGSGADSHRFIFDIGLALIECSPGAYADEQVLDVLVSGASGKFEMSLATRGRPIPRIAKGHALTGLLDDIQIEPPVRGELECCGGMVLRRTRFPAATGAEVWIGAALMRSPIELLPEREMFTLMGVPGQRLSMASPEEIPEAFSEGGSPEQTFSQPIWGFGKRRAIHSTLHLDAIDAGKEYIPLIMTEDPTDAQRDRIAELEDGGLVAPFRSSKWNGEYRTFRRRILERGAMPPLDGYPTEEESASQIAVIKDIVRQMKLEALDHCAPGL